MRLSPARRALGLVAVLGGLLLVASLFLDWYEAEAGQETLTFDGWSAFELADAAFVLLLLAVLWRLGANLSGTGPGSPGLLPLGIAAIVLVAVLVLTETPVLQLLQEGEGVTTSVSLGGGAYLGIGGAALLFVAGLVDRLLTP